MGKLPPRRRKTIGVATHYSYLGGGGRNDTREGVPRRVVAVHNLTGVTVLKRRKMIHNYIRRNGSCLARLPFQFEINCDWEKLERFLEGEL